VTDGNGVVNNKRAFSQTAQETEIFFIQRLPGPFYTGRSYWIKGLNRIQPGHSFVMIASNQRTGTKGLNLLNNFIRRSSITNQITKKKVMFNLFFLVSLKTASRASRLPWISEKIN